MLKTSLQINDYVSLAVMLLMAVALVSGQAGASAATEGELQKVVSPIAAMDDRISIDFDGRLGDAAMKISIAVATDLSHFRGENE